MVGVVPAIKDHTGKGRELELLIQSIRLGILTYRFYRDDKSWVRDLKVFMDMGRPMPSESLALLKTSQHLREGYSATRF